MFKCALVKPIGLLCQHAAEEMALNGFRGMCVCVFLSVCLCACFNMLKVYIMLVGVNVCVTEKS